MTEEPLMSDEEAQPKKKKKKGKKKLVLFLGVLLLAGGGGAGFYFMQGGATEAKAAEADVPQLVRKGGRVPEGDEKPGEGSPYEASYFQLEKEFTSNLRDSVHFIQLGIAVSTDYDSRVIENVKRHEIAVRSAVLMTLSETDEEEVFTAEGKKQLQKRLTKAINETLREKEGFGGIGNVYFTNFIVQ